MDENKPVESLCSSGLQKHLSTSISPVLVKQARKSGVLNLANKVLIKVPDDVWKIDERKENVWWEQLELSKLLLASNKLTCLSEDISQLPGLTVLDVHDNFLSYLPDAIGKLKNLQKLDLSHNKLAVLPACLGKLHCLQRLHLDHNKIKALTIDFEELKCLEVLVVSHNQLSSLPSSMTTLHNLMKLNLANNRFQEMPQCICFLQNLRVLDCTHNEIPSAPDELGDLPRLEELNLRNNKLTELPVIHSSVPLKELHLGNNVIEALNVEHLEHLESLHMLDLKHNKLSKIPDEITVLHQLERLDISNNNITRLPNSIGVMKSLKCLILDGNPLKYIRRDVIMRGTSEVQRFLRNRMTESELVAANMNKEWCESSGVVSDNGEGVNSHQVRNNKTLDYSDKKVKHIPDELWSLAAKAEVRICNFSKNALTEWPQKLSELGESLEELNLSLNKISTVDVGVNGLKGLVYLDLASNLLSDLPEDLSALQFLKELVLSFNRFRAFPPVVYNLPKLEILLVNDNQIQDIDPTLLKGLEQLATLDLRNNDLMHVPPELGLCTQITKLQLEGNAFRQPRPQILAKGTLEILKYLRDRIVR